jgi:hypothetical protein
MSFGVWVLMIDAWGIFGFCFFAMFDYILSIFEFMNVYIWVSLYSKYLMIWEFTPHDAHTNRRSTHQDAKKTRLSTNYIDDNLEPRPFSYFRGKPPTTDPSR